MEKVKYNWIFVSQESGFCYDPNATTPSEICHDILFREGVNPQVSGNRLEFQFHCEYSHTQFIYHFQGHVTYTPRLILVDHKNALKHLPQNGGLYTDPSPFGGTESEFNFSEQNTLWEPERLTVIKSEAAEKSEFQRDLDANAVVEIGSTEKDYDLRNTVTTWTDYLSTRYHPRSFNLLRTIGESTESQQFDCYTAGTQLWTDEYFEDDFGDRVRQYIEECNNCQGFQLLFDATDGFSGLSVKCLEHLSDEYGKSSLVVPIFSPNQTKYGAHVDETMADSIRILNTALTYGHVIEHSSLILPLSVMARNWRKIEQPRHFPYFDYDANNLYETSAILATYLDTMTLRYRINGCTHLAGFCSDLSNNGRKLVGAGLAMPFHMDSEHDLIDCLDRFEDKMFTQLSPNTNCGTDRIVQTVSVRGIADTRLKNTRSPKIAERQMKMAAYKCDSVAEMLQLYFQCNNYASLAHVSALQAGMRTRKPFPLTRFDYRINTNGFFNEFAMASDTAVPVQSIPVMATAQCSSDLADTLESLHREAKRIKIARIARFNETGLEPDELVDALEHLMEFKDNYDDTFQL